MAFYYAQWYGFYEGNTEFRADPISVVSIFGLKSIEELNKTFAGKMDQAFSKQKHGTPEKTGIIPQTFISITGVCPRHRSFRAFCQQRAITAST